MHRSGSSLSGQLVHSFVLEYFTTITEHLKFSSLVQKCASAHDRVINNCLKIFEDYSVSACLPGAEALPDIDVGKRKFNINIVMPSSDQTGELRLSFETVRKFATIFLKHFLPS